MSHTSAQSSHNPAPDLGPEPSVSASVQQISEWMHTVTDALQALQERISFLAQVTADANSSVHKRLQVLENADTMPMLLDLSLRLEAMEEIQEKHNQLLFSHAEDFKVLDARSQQTKKSQQTMAEALTRSLL